MKLLATTILTFVLGTMFVSLFHMSHMDMHGGMVDCPFMHHQETICPMNLADHLGAWKGVFLAIAPSVLLLLVGSAFVIGIASVAPNLLQRTLFHPIPIPMRVLTERTYSYVHRPLQELFANGILHPKLFL